MAKRRRVTQSSDENWSDASNAEPESDIEDASFIPITKVPSKRKPTLAQRKSKIRESDASASTSAATNLLGGPHSADTHVIQEPISMRVALLKWYTTVHETRGMPWRKAYDPHLGPDERAQRAYEVWVSEIMLQQTQVATVIPYYKRWMEKFPTISDLAAASVDEVNALWKGLGYYSRASRLLAGAQKVVKDFGGRLPDNAKEMEANIPGIGRYSAGAICSIAYGEQVPVLDGNVHRLLSRVLALHANPKAKPTLDILWAGASAMVEIGTQPQISTNLSSSGLQESQHPGDINQALIELGSTVCKVKDPNCESCPIQPWCFAYKRSAIVEEHTTSVVDIEDSCRLCEPISSFEGVTSYPMKVDKKKAREELDIVNVVEWRSRTDSCDRQFLFVRRPEVGLLAGLYEFPSCSDVSRTITHSVQEKTALSLVGMLLTEESPTASGESAADATSSFSITKIVPVGDVLHVFSHIKKTYRVQWVLLEGGTKPPPPPKDITPIPKRTGKKLKTGSNCSTSSAVGALPKSAVWTPLERVTSMNMGTGVVKVWNLTRKLWETEDS